MTEYHRISAWYNTEEWFRAYNYIYSEPSDLNEALNLLLIWKARSPFLPSGVESTLILLQVYVQDVNSHDDSASERIIRLAYSSAIMRFVNHMFDSQTMKGQSLYNAAKYLGIPDWIVDLRHDTAHGNNLPTLELFREATLFGFDWLRNNYWDKQKTQIQDFVTGVKVISVGVQERIEVLMNIFSTLSICAHSKCRIKNLAEIPNPTMRQSIVDDLQYVFRGNINLSKLKTVTIANIVKNLDDLAKELFHSKDMINHMNKLLLGSNSLFLSKELITFMGPVNLIRKKDFNDNYVQCFELLLTFLHTNNLLIDFILELIKITRSQDENSNHKALIAALWLKNILAALQRCKKFITKTKMMNSEDIMSKTRKELKTLYHHWFPNENIDNILLLDLQKGVPSELTDIIFIQPIISEYNPYLTYFVKNLLDFVEPALPTGVFSKICNLAKVISGTVQKSGKTSKIYTVDDLKLPDHVDLTEQMDIDDEAVPLPTECADVEVNLYGVWKLASKNYSWDTTPIGQLPWTVINEQKTEQNCVDM
ncbi:uncharacterized protein LOC115440114 [Manduca sexta]|uniref:uncharacterized protein LOC115440114 n=1 Tax=Manduca sexta TaxID=7130 RepID=UPI00188E41C4|nr:uncharacterized protein LOC115440114 [Manduca sexta]